MAYGVVWKYVSPDKKQTHKVMALTDVLAEAVTSDDAKKEGRDTLANLPALYKSCMNPMSIVEVDSNILNAIDECEILTISGPDERDEELLFAIVDDFTCWKHQDWWSQ